MKKNHNYILSKPTCICSGAAATLPLELEALVMAGWFFGGFFRVFFFRLLACCHRSCCVQGERINESQKEYVVLYNIHVTHLDNTIIPCFGECTRVVQYILSPNFVMSEIFSVTPTMQTIRLFSIIIIVLWRKLFISGR